jgi:hypothetical protein
MNFWAGVGIGAVVVIVVIAIAYLDAARKMRW